MLFGLCIGMVISEKAFAQQTDTTRVLSGGELKEVKVLSPYEKWQKDSAENRLIHRKELSDAVFKPSIVKIGKVPIPIGMVGGFTWLALKVSGKQKKFRKFKAQLEADEQEKQFAIRYHPALVKRLTGLEDDSAVYVFIRENPMPRDFYNSATELELMQWIRDRYRTWYKKAKEIRPLKP